MLREYAKKAPTRSGYPRPAAAHAWLGASSKTKAGWKKQRRNFRAR